MRKSQFVAPGDTLRAVEKVLDAKTRRQHEAKVRGALAATAAAKLRKQREQNARLYAPKTDRRGKGLWNQKLSLPGWQVLITRMQPDVGYSGKDIKQLMPEYKCPLALLHGKPLRAMYIRRREQPSRKVLTMFDRKYVWSLDEEGIDLRRELLARPAVPAGALTIEEMLE